MFPWDDKPEFVSGELIEEVERERILDDMRDALNSS